MTDQSDFCSHGIRPPRDCIACEHPNRLRSLVARLREDADAWAGPEGQNDYADTVLVEREAADEIDRLNKWADGFSDRQLEERRTAEAYQRELREEITRLQRALNFWLPGVPADDPEIAERAGDDSFLLCGLDSEPEKSAEELGWIKLREKAHG